MAKRTLYATKDMRDPIYRTRMLKAGEPVEVDGPTARLYLHLRIATEEKPKRTAAPVVAQVAEGEQVAVAKPKATRKRTRRKK